MTSATPVVVLIGPPGAGKSTVARLLAERLGVSVRDTDVDVEHAAGLSVADIFVEHGEPHFRCLERDAVARALAEHGGVLSLGGGAVLDPATQEALTGLPVVFLDVSASDAARRVGLNRDRPLLVGNPRAAWAALMRERRPIYARLARWVVDTDGRSPQEVAEEVERSLRTAPTTGVAG